MRLSKVITQSERCKTSEEPSKRKTFKFIKLFKPINKLAYYISSLIRDRANSFVMIGSTRR
ncbi:MAG: hypothetical protein ACTS4X_01130 [Candidatus Hodgkinia cicadicola]